MHGVSLAILKVNIEEAMKKINDMMSHLSETKSQTVVLEWFRALRGKKSSNIVHNFYIPSLKKAMQWNLARLMPGWP